MSSPKGHVRGVSVSDGGVPKLPVARARVSADGMEGDRQRHTSMHGGPERAVCLLAESVIAALAAEGHPIVPGSTGENLTLAGLPTGALAPGVRIAFDGGLRIELTNPAAPCAAIRASFHDGDPKHLDAKRDPERTRHYARVLTSGDAWPGQTFTIEGPPSVHS